jgi:hypothetical protein
MHEAAQRGPRFRQQPEAEHPKIVSYPQVRPADYPIFSSNFGHITASTKIENWSAPLELDSFMRRF